jgi:hypothetical protein
MKKILLLLLAAGSLWITGCETTREISFNRDESGTLITTTDLSSLIGMVKMSGQDKDLDKLKDEVIDTTILLDKAADSLKGISTEERSLIKKGKVGMQMNMAEEKFIIKLELPFSNPVQIGKLDKLSTKLMQQTLKKQMAAAGKEDMPPGMPGENEMPEGSIEDYFITTYSKNAIEKKLIREKYADVGNDESMKTLKEMSTMGIGNATLIINLPRPAKKTEGKNIKLSDDKKKVIITSSAEDFFEDAAALEFKIEF